MSKITTDFVYKSFPKPSFRADIKNGVLKGHEIVNKKRNELRLNKSGEDIELKIISNIHPSPGPTLLWKYDKLLTVPEVCDYMEECGLPAVLKIVGGSPLLKLDKNDKLLAFIRGVERRRFCEEQDSGKCYTICCEKTFSELQPENSSDHSSIDRWRTSAEPMQKAFFLGGDSERKAIELKTEVITNLKNQKHGTKYPSKFLVALSMKNDLLGYQPFLISADMGLMFSIAVGIENCSTEEWVEYCNGHHRTTKQFSIPKLIQVIKLEKLYLDDMHDDANNNESDVLPFYLDNYVIPPAYPKFSLTSRSDDSVIGQQRDVGLAQLNVQQLSYRSTSSSNLHPQMLSTNCDRKYQQSKRNLPIMGASAKEVSIKTSGAFNKFKNRSYNALETSLEGAKHINSFSSEVAETPNSLSTHATKESLVVPTLTVGRSISPTWTISSAASSPSNISFFNKVKTNNSTLDEGYYTKSDVGISF